MSWVTTAVIGGAVIGAGTSAYINHQNQEDAQDKWDFAQSQSATAAYADADAAIGAANAEAAAVMGQAEAEANAFIGQAEQERSILYQQAEAARGIATANISKMKQEADESLRRLEGEQTSWEAKARAKAAASGVRMLDDTSTGLYLTGMEKENNKQYGWLDKSYKAGLDVAKSTADAEYNITQRKGDASIEAARIRGQGAIEGASFVAEATTASGNYYAEAMRTKGDSYLAPGKAKQKATDDALFAYLNMDRGDGGM